MKTFKIPVSWEVCATIEVVAETAEEALRLANEKEDSKNPYSLPKENEYVDGSFEIEQDIEIIEAFNSQKREI